MRNISNPPNNTSEEDNAFVQNNDNNPDHPLPDDESIGGTPIPTPKENSIPVENNMPVNEKDQIDSTAPVVSSATLVTFSKR